MKSIEEILLFDLYGNLLTKKQQDFLGYYLNDDLSLGEIAENEGISRQGVFDAIKKAENQLSFFEEQLGLLKKRDEVLKALSNIDEENERIKQINLDSYFSREINDCTAKISGILQTLTD